MQRFEVDRYCGRIVIEAACAEMVDGEWIFRTDKGLTIMKIPAHDVRSIGPAPPSRHALAFSSAEESD